MSAAPVFFQDRGEAGRLLATRLLAREWTSPIVYALPRGGLPVGAPVAAALQAPLDVVLVRKVGVPGQPELALAAVADGAAPEIAVNRAIADRIDRDGALLAAGVRAALADIEARRERLIAGRPRLQPSGRDAILVDDGLATGATAEAALRALRHAGARRVVLAAPVAPADTAARLRREADAVVLLHEPEAFHAVGQFYADFDEVSDEEAAAVLRAAEPAAPPPH